MKLYQMHGRAETMAFFDSCIQQLKFQKIFQQNKNYETLDMLPAISAPDATSIEFVNNSPSTLAV